MAIAHCTSQVIDPAELPPDASQTLYLERLPQDLSKRELAHIFRPFEGYAVSSIKRSKVWQSKSLSVGLKDVPVSMPARSHHMSRSCLMDRLLLLVLA